MWRIFTKSEPKGLSPTEAEQIKKVMPTLYIRPWKTDDLRHPAVDPKANDRIGDYHVASVDHIPGGKIFFYDISNNKAEVHNCSLPEWQAWASNYLTANPDAKVYVFEKYE